MSNQIRDLVITQSSMRQKKHGNPKVKLEKVDDDLSVVTSMKDSDEKGNEIVSSETQELDCLQVDSPSSKSTPRQDHDIGWTQYIQLKEAASARNAKRCSKRNYNRNKRESRNGDWLRKMANTSETPESRGTTSTNKKRRMNRSR